MADKPSRASLQPSLTPNITTSKSKGLLGANQDYSDTEKAGKALLNTSSQTRLNDANSTNAGDNVSTRRSPFMTSKKHPADESVDNVSMLPTDKNNTAFGSPQLTQKSKADGGLVSSFGTGQATISTNMPGGSNQKGYMTFGSPEKTSTGKGLNRSARSNSSRGSSGGNRRSIHKSANRRSTSTDPDSTERSFIYPCQAFKQFLMTVREGKIDMKDIGNSPFLMDYLAMQTQMGGGSGSAGDSKPFSQSLRQTSKTSPMRNSLSRGRDSSGHQNTHTKMQRPSAHSIQEEAHEDEHHAAADSLNMKKKQAKFPTAQARTQAQHSPSPDAQVKKSMQSNSSPQLTKGKPGNTNQGSNVAKNNNQDNRSSNIKNNNQEESKEHPRQSNLKPSASEHKQTSSEPRQTSDSKQASSAQKQRRGRHERSTSGDDQQLNNSTAKDVRFDEKGRPIATSTKQDAKNSLVNPNLSSSPDMNKSQKLSTSQQSPDQNKPSGSKERRGRNNRDSSQGKDGNTSIPVAASQNSPFEPRSVSKLPKPINKELTPQRTVQKQQTQEDEGTFRDYNENVANTRGSHLEDEESKIPLFKKNTDFSRTDLDYALDAFKDEQQPKKYLKNNKASPLKKQVFKEDLETPKGSNVDNEGEDEGIYQDEDANNNNNKSEIQSEKGQQEDEGAKMIDIVGIMQKKSPTREKRKVGNQLNESQNLNNLSGISGGPYGVASAHDGIFGENPTSMYEASNADLDRSQRFRDFLEQQSKARKANQDPYQSVGDVNSQINTSMPGGQKELPQSPPEKKKRRGRANRGGSGSSDHSQERSTQKPKPILYDLPTRNRAIDQENSNPMDLASGRQLSIVEHLDTFRSKTSSHLLHQDNEDNNDNYGQFDGESDSEKGDEDEYPYVSSAYKQQNDNSLGQIGQISPYKKYTPKKTSAQANAPSGQDAKDALGDGEEFKTGDDDEVNKSGNKEAGSTGKKQRRGRKSRDKSLDANAPDGNTLNPNRQLNDQYGDGAGNNRDLDDNGLENDDQTYPQDPRSSSFGKDPSSNKHQNTPNTDINQQVPTKKSQTLPFGNKDPLSASPIDKNKNSSDEYIPYGANQNPSMNPSPYSQRKQRNPVDPSETKNPHDDLSKPLSSKILDSSPKSNKGKDDISTPSKYKGDIIPDKSQALSKPLLADYSQPPYADKSNPPPSSIDPKSISNPTDAPYQKRAQKKPLQQSSNNKPEESKKGDNPSSNNKDEGPSKLKALEQKLKDSVLANPTKPLDYALIRDLQDEAAKVIQRKFRELKNIDKDDGKQHGKFVDRKVQTDPVNPFKLAHGGNDLDNFRKFFFAVYYTYMMMNTCMAEAFKKKQ